MKEDPLEAVYRRYFPLIRAKCSRMLCDATEAQDVAQETFTRFWSKQKELRHPDAIVPWLYRTATRLAVDRLRHRALMQRSAVEDSERSYSPERQIEFREALFQLARHMKTREMEVLILSRLDGMTHDEIAELWGTSDRTVRRLLQKADSHVRTRAGSAP